MSWIEHVVWATSSKDEPLDARDPPLSRVAAMFLRDVPSLTEVPFAKMTSLRHLELANPAKNLRSLDGIQRATKLTLLVCPTRVLTEIVPLGSLGRLEVLDVGGNRIGDLSPLATCKRLKTLYARKNPIRSVEPLAELRALEKIDLGKTLVKDILPLAALPRLSALAVPLKLPKENLAAFKAKRRNVKISF